jgi:hypothetical protein
LSNIENYMMYSRKEPDTPNNFEGKPRKRKYGIGGGSFGGDLFGSIAGIGAMLGTLGVAKWLSDKGNSDAVGGILKFGKGLFDLASNIAGFGANNLMDGLSKVLGDKSILSKLLGGAQALAGLVALRWLINPFKIIKDLKSIPKIFKNLGKLNSALSMSLADLGKWVKVFSAGIYKDITKSISRTVLKIFGRDVFKVLRGIARGIGSGVKGVAGGVAKGALNFASKFIPKGALNFASKFIPIGVVKNFAKFVTKIPIVGSILGFGVNLLLGDTPQKAGFKLVTAGLGTFLGGLVGGVFPPAIPVTATIGAVIGDYLGDFLYDKFIPPKLATGGIVSHTSKSGTHVIVSEEEDEVVIPLSMLTMDNLIGSKFYEPIKLVAANILGAVNSVINNNSGIFNLSSDINTSLISLSKTFGSTTIVNKQKTKGYTETRTNTQNLTNSNNTTKILGKDNISSVALNNSDNLQTNTSVRGLLTSILDVIVNPNAIKGDRTNMIPTNTPPAIVQPANSTSQAVAGTLLASGRATYYDPNDVNDTTAGGHTLSTGERYDSNTFSGAVFPDIILKLPEKYTSPTKVRPAYFKGKTIKKPFMIRMVQTSTGKQAYIRINDVGIGVMGDSSRLVDMSAATKKFFGGDSGGMQVYLAPDNVKAGALPNIPRMAEGGVYTYNSAPHKRHGGARRNRKHAGEDFDMRSDGTFQSKIGGTVVYQGYQPGKNLYGNFIDIYNDKLKTSERIAEAGSFSVKLGDKINPGQIVSSGTSTGMIHYEIRKQDKYKTQFGYNGTSDPIAYLSSIGAISVSGNTVRNNALASLVDNTSNVANNPTSPINTPASSATPTTNLSSNVGDTSVATSDALGNAFATLTQQLGIIPSTTNRMVDGTNNRISGRRTNTIVRQGNTNNVVAVAQNIINQNSFAYTNLRMV